MRIDVHSSFDAAYRDAPVAEMAGYGFQSRGWLQAYAETLGAGERVLLVTLSDDRVRLLLPLSIARRRGLATLGFLGGGVTDYNAPLIDPDLAARLDAAGIAALWARIRAALPRHHVVRLARMPETLDAPGGQVPNPFALLPGAVVAGVAHAASLAGGVPPPRSQAGNIRRARAQLDRIGAVTLDVARTPADRAALVERLMAMKSRRWRETGATDWSAMPAFRAFYDRVAALPEDALAVHASTLRCGEEAIATHLGFRYGARFCFIQFGWAAGEWRRYSPGLQFVAALMSAVAEEGVALFDFTGGDEAYKRIWADTRLPLLALEQGVGVRGRAAIAARAMAGRLASRLKRIGRLRAIVRKVRRRGTA